MAEPTHEWLDAPTCDGLWWYCVRTTRGWKPPVLTAVTGAQALILLSPSLQDIGGTLHVKPGFFRWLHQPLPSPPHDVASSP